MYHPGGRTLLQGKVACFHTLMHRTEWRTKNSCEWKELHLKVPHWWQNCLHPKVWFRETRTAWNLLLQCEEGIEKSETHSSQCEAIRSKNIQQILQSIYWYWSVLRNNQRLCIESIRLVWFQSILQTLVTEINKTVHIGPIGYIRNRVQRQLFQEWTHDSIEIILIAEPCTSNFWQFILGSWLWPPHGHDLLFCHHPCHSYHGFCSQLHLIVDVIHLPSLQWAPHRVAAWGWSYCGTLAGTGRELE